MRFDVLTLFPDDFKPVGVIKRGLEENKFQLNYHDIKKFGLGKYRSVDDEVYGGGAGMLLRPDVMDQALNSIERLSNSLVVLPSPRGIQFTQEVAKKLISYDQLIFVCPRYEGIDQRFIDASVDLELSLGPYVVSGGDLAASVFIDCLARLIPGVLGNEESLIEETSSTMNEYSQYTRPSEYNNFKVPEVLMSGNHKLIQEFRANSSKKYQSKKPENF